jgi:membrane-bound ClpP family serine protease
MLDRFLDLLTDPWVESGVLAVGCSGLVVAYLEWREPVVLGLAVLFGLLTLRAIARTFTD